MGRQGLKAFQFNIQAEGQGSLRQATMYQRYLFGEQKQQEVKSTKKIHQGIITGSSL